MGKVLVFDVDDTISIHKNRDYPNAQPIQPVIDKLNRLHDEGYYIKLFTGRGQLSCNGDLNLIIERNKDVLETWLKNHGVKYDELIFGKPVGDWYIDDKGLSVSEFLKAEFCELKGGSNSSIRREYDKVIKQSKTSQSQYYWYRLAKDNNIDKLDHIDLPHIFSCVGDTLYMEYIDGRHLCDCLNENDLHILVKTCYKFKQIKSNCELGLDIDAYCDNLLKHLYCSTSIEIAKLVNQNKEALIKRASFCHGDFTLSNIIKRDDRLIIFDPNYKKDYTSYLLDLSKIRQSLHDYELLFKFSTNSNNKYLKMFDELVASESKEDLKLVKLLDLTHWIRMYDYKNDDDKLIVSQVLNELYKEYKNEYTKG